MAKYAFNREDAMILKQVARERRNKPVDGANAVLPTINAPGFRSYLAIPLETISAASLMGETLTLAKGEVKIIRRNHESTGLGTIEQRDTKDEQVKVDAYNFAGEKVLAAEDAEGSGTNATTVCFVVEDTWGTFYIVRVWRFEESSGSGSEDEGSAGSEGSEGEGSAGSGSGDCVEAIDAPVLEQIGNEEGHVLFRHDDGCMSWVPARLCSSGSGS